eukprot:5643113-Prymnesium_polylepis.1
MRTTQAGGEGRARRSRGWGCVCGPHRGVGSHWRRRRTAAHKRLAARDALQLRQRRRHLPLLRAREQPPQQAALVRRSERAAARAHVAQQRAGGKLGVGRACGRCRGGERRGGGGQSRGARGR